MHHLNCVRSRAAEKPRELTEKEKLAAALFGGVATSGGASSGVGRGRKSNPPTSTSTGAPSIPLTTSAPAPSASNDLDLLGFGGGAPAPAPAAGGLDLFGGLAPAAPAAPGTPGLPTCFRVGDAHVTTTVDVFGADVQCCLHRCQ